MDIVERYQFYLNHLSILNQSSFMATQLFYNCTLPRFGPLCQYSLDNYISHNSSLYEIIYNFYQHEYNPINLTCYTHLEYGIDEEFCGQLYFSDCEENEYQCANGQCISKIFLHDNRNTFECLDRTDEILKDMKGNSPLSFKFRSESTFATEDITCPQRHNPNHMKLTSSCPLTRVQILEELLFNDKPIEICDDCWIAVKCQSGIYDRFDPRCFIHCSKRTCKEIIDQSYPDILPVSAGTIVFGHIFFIYTKEDMIKFNARSISPSYVCYNDQLCDEFYPNKSLIPFNNATCRRPADFPLKLKSFALTRGNWFNMYILPLYQELSHCNKIHYNESANCNNLTMYKCINSSMFISKHRLCDNVTDCKYNDDEECTQINGSCLLHGLDNLFKCTTTNICISPALVKDGWCQCGSDQYAFCDDEDLNNLYIRKHVSFTTICDGCTELIPVTINGRYKTDETECEYWQCTDEIDCYSSSLSFNCPYQHYHICVSPQTNQFMCLPLEKHHQRCHRGLPLRIWLNIDQNLTIAACLCPPSFYGNMCQYQNQRVSLTLRFQTFSDSRRTLFALIILLIDDSNERIIHSYQQLTYIYIRDCQTKFNIYLLYSTRPKKSFLIPLKYPFLPVHRVGVQLNIPRTNDGKENCVDQPCIHGQCIRYLNDKSFCQCYHEWTGKYCTIPHRCTRSSDSLCIAISSNNRSICICPLHKWGSQYLLHNTICYSNQNATCQIM
ncbi:unnamed protein product, partial [Rotaria sordida]